MLDMQTAPSLSPHSNDRAVIAAAHPFACNVPSTEKIDYSSFCTRCQKQGLPAHQTPKLAVISQVIELANQVLKPEDSCYTTIKSYNFVLLRPSKKSLTYIWLQGWEIGSGSYSKVFSAIAVRANKLGPVIIKARAPSGSSEYQKMELNRAYERLKGMCSRGW